MLTHHHSHTTAFTFGPLFHILLVEIVHVDVLLSVRLEEGVRWLILTAV